MSSKKGQVLKILLADDGSQHAQAAVNFMRDLPLASKSHVHVLRVFPASQAVMVPQMESHLKRTEEQFLECGISADSKLVPGHPAEMIVKTAKAKKPNLVVIGAKGLRATLGILLGGVAQQVVEYSDYPVLVVRAPYHGLNHVLLVTDGSENSEYAARYLSKFPLPGQVEVDVIHALAPMPFPVVMEPYFGGRDTYVPMHSAEEERALAAKQEQEGDVLLDRTGELLLNEGIESSPVLVRGDAATEIIDYSDKEYVDLIVAGSRGLSSFQGWLMGSVSRKLVHYSNCSVLIVKQPE